MVTTEQVIDNLSRDLLPVRPRAGGDGLALLWWLVVLAAAVALAVLTGHWRPGAFGELLSAPRFALEMGLGVVALLSLTLLLFRMAVPGRGSRRVTVIALGIALLWPAMLVWNGLAPPVAVSVLGKRPHCAIEVFAIALVPALHGAWLLLRRYPLRPVPTVAGIVLVAGLAPALVMQLACMYSPRHALMYHWFPALLMALLTAGIMALARRRP